jgi:hypothetical protein
VARTDSGSASGVLRATLPMRTPWRTWVRTDSHPLRPVAAERAAAGAVKVVTRAHKKLIFRTHPPHPAAAPCAARIFPGRAAGV